MPLVEALPGLVKAQALSGLMMSAAAEERRDYWTVLLHHLDTITVVTVTMLELPVLYVSSNFYRVYSHFSLN